MSATTDGGGVLNKFSVAARGDTIVVLNPPLQAGLRAPGSGLPDWPAIAPLSRAEALNLAAWLVAVTGERARFLELLDAVERT